MLLTQIMSMIQTMLTDFQCVCVCVCVCVCQCLKSPYGETQALNVVCVYLVVLICFETNHV